MNRHAASPNPTCRLHREHLPGRRWLGGLWPNVHSAICTLAAALQAFVGYGVGGFASAFLMRSHAMTVAQAGGALALIAVLGGGLGTYLGGSVADRFTDRFQIGAGNSGLRPSRP